MIKRITFFIALFAESYVCAQSLSQTVNATAGDFYQNGTASLSWTIGEPIVNTLENGSLRLTQGFHQPYLAISSIYELGNIGIRLYPNPSKSMLNIDITETGSFSADLYDLLGRKLQSFSIVGNHYSLDLTDFAAANYFIRIYNSEKHQIATYKIQKIR
jgi:hypothetical protein